MLSKSTSGRHGWDSSLSLDIDCELDSTRMVRQLDVSFHEEEIL
jgi:hypothetical protein